MVGVGGVGMGVGQEGGGGEHGWGPRGGPRGVMVVVVVGAWRMEFALGSLSVVLTVGRTQMFALLYGKTAAGLYARAAGQNAKARQLYNASADTYYKANDAAAYDDWVRARNHWDYFYNRS